MTASKKSQDGTLRRSGQGREFRSIVMHHRVGGKLGNEILFQILGTSGDRKYIIIKFSFLL
jgi:hypothetical protein